MPIWAAWAATHAAAAIAADLEAKDLESLACEVWELWLKAGAQSKTKWVLSFTAVFGGAAMTPKLIHAINDWPQNARGAIACDAVAALAVSPDPAALVAVDSISRKFKFRQVKAAAAAAGERCPGAGHHAGGVGGPHCPHAGLFSRRFPCL